MNKYKREVLHKSMNRNRNKRAQEALSRARGGLALSNYPTIISGFIEKGIPEEQILPRVNVLTYDAWKALGRHVRKGEHGVKVLTWLQMEGKQEVPQYDENEMLVENKDKPKSYRRPWSTTVFHVSQTEPYTNDAVQL